MLEVDKCYCPYCGERIEVVLDLSMGDHQEYIEDCSVCCRPIVFSIYQGVDDEHHIDVKTEND